MSVKQEAQIAMFDRTIENPELEEAIERMRDAEDGAKQYAAARKPVKEMIENMALTDGERVRVGRFVITVKARIAVSIAALPPSTSITSSQEP